MRTFTEKLISIIVLSFSAATLAGAQSITATPNPQTLYLGQETEITVTAQNVAYGQVSCYTFDPLGNEIGIGESPNVPATFPFTPTVAGTYRFTCEFQGWVYYVPGGDFECCGDGCDYQNCNNYILVSETIYGGTFINVLPLTSELTSPPQFITPSPTEPLWAIHVSSPTRDSSAYQLFAKENDPPIAFA